MRHAEESSWRKKTPSRVCFHSSCGGICRFVHVLCRCRRLIVSGGSRARNAKPGNRRAPTARRLWRPGVVLTRRLLRLQTPARGMAARLAVMGAAVARLPRRCSPLESIRHGRSPGLGI